MYTLQKMVRDLNGGVANDLSPRRHTLCPEGHPPNDKELLDILEEIKDDYHMPGHIHEGC